MVGPPSEAERNGTVFDGLLVDVGGRPLRQGDFQDTTGLLKKLEAVRLAQGDAETCNRGFRMDNFP